MEPNSTHSRAGTHPQITASAGPTIGPVPAMEVKWWPKMMPFLVGHVVLVVVEFDAGNGGLGIELKIFRASQLAVGMVGNRGRERERRGRWPALASFNGDERWRMAEIGVARRRSRTFPDQISDKRISFDGRRWARLSMFASRWKSNCGNRFSPDVVLVLVFAAFVKEWASPDLVAMGGFIIGDSFSPVRRRGVGPALMVFGSSAPLTVAAMFIVSAALERTGLIEALGFDKFESVAGGSAKVRVLVILLLLVALPLGFRQQHAGGGGLPADRAATLPQIRSQGLEVPDPPVLRGHRRRHLHDHRHVDQSDRLGHRGGPDRAFEPFGMFEVAKLGVIFVAATLIYLLCGGCASCFRTG